jgi:hypothetical protein
MLLSRKLKAVVLEVLVLVLFAPLSLTEVASRATDG